MTRPQKSWLAQIAHECGLDLKQLILGIALGLWCLPWDELGPAPTGGRVDHVKLRLDDRQWRELNDSARAAALPLEQYVQDVCLGTVSLQGGADRVPLTNRAGSELRQALDTLDQLMWNEFQQGWTRYRTFSPVPFRPTVANQESIRTLLPLVQQLKTRRQLGLELGLESELLLEKTDILLAKIREQIK
jgi:hypothetical protein